VTPRTIVLSPLSGGTLTLTASGGPVNWSITESPGLIGELAVAPTSGRLLAGQSTTIGLRVSAGAGALTAQAARAGAALTSATGVCVSCTLTVNPGDLTVTVLIEINASPSPSKPSCPPSSSPPPSSYSPGTETGSGCRNARLAD
jgi:hypothetical protein